MPARRGPSTGRRATALVIGDLGRVGTALPDRLAAEGLDAAHAADAAAGLAAVADRRPDVVIVSLALPGLDGVDFIRTLHELVDAPVLAVLDRRDDVRTVGALRAGADDCAAGAGALELAVRAAGLLRRLPAPAASGALHRDEFVVVDGARHRVEARGVEVDLTPTEFRLLAALAGRPGEVVEHEELAHLIWGDARRRGRSEPKLYVSYVRRKMIQAAGVDPFETVRGVGYRYLPRVREPVAG